MGTGAARYSTCFQGIDPDRLSNPYQQQDTRYLRGGVEIVSGPQSGETPRLR